MRPASRSRLRRGALFAVLGLALAGCGGAGGVVPSTGNVTLQQVQAQVFTPSCALTDCHTQPDPEMDMDLSAGQAAAAVIGVQSIEQSSFLRVEPGNAADSYVYMKITSDPRISGDPMPATGGPLSAGAVQLVEDWIDQGAN